MIQRINMLAAFAGLAFALSGPAVSARAAPDLDLGGSGWEVVGEGAVVEEFDGRLALRLGSGKATFRELEFLDGTIEFDLQVTEHRSFCYLYFRMENDDEHEEFYFRPHKSRLPDAVQYAPVYKGRSQWQLYHAAGSTAAVVLPAGEWIPIKVVVRGARAAVFVGGAQEPQLIVPRLAREPRGGFVALRSFRPAGVPEDAYVSSFANVVVRPGVVEYQFPAPETVPAKVGSIKTWQVSRGFVPSDGPVLEVPQEIARQPDWKRVPATATGLVELERYVERPENARRAAVVARLPLVAEEAKTVRLDLGFSDELSLFLNGRLVLVDDESYSFTHPRRQGLLTDDQLSVFIALEKGANEVMLVVTDRFGGWGLSGRLEEIAGVRLEAPE